MLVQIDFYSENPIVGKTLQSCILEDSNVYDNIIGNGDADWKIENNNDLRITSQEDLYINGVSSIRPTTDYIELNNTGQTAYYLADNWYINYGLASPSSPAIDIFFGGGGSNNVNVYFMSANTIKIGGGTNGQVLTTDGSSNLSWDDPTINVSTNNVLLGRATTGAGSVEEISIGSGLTLTGTTLSASGGGGGMQVQVDTITSTQTWTKPVWGKYYKVYLIGGGSGGGSGARYPITSNRCGGAGGAGSTMVYGEFIDSSIASSILVTIGAGGSGGASVTTDNTNGNNGIPGGISSFGNLLATFLNGDGGGRGGTTSPSSIRGQGYSNVTPFVTLGSFISGNQGLIQAGASRVVSNEFTFVLNSVGGAGGAGNGANSTTTQNGGTFDLWSAWRSIPPSSGGTNGGNGNNGVSYNYSFLTLGTSGGGGSYKTAQATGNGGNGVFGSGGGGGAGSDNGFNSGAGGNGGDGICIIVTFG